MDSLIIGFKRKSYEQNVGDLEDNIKKGKKHQEIIENCLEELGEVQDPNKRSELINRIEESKEVLTGMSKKMVEGSKQFSNYMDALKEIGKVKENKEQEDMVDVYNKADLNDSDTYHKITKKLLNAYIIEKMMFNRNLRQL